MLLTDDPEVLGWAISLPDEVGAVTRVAAVTAHDDLDGESDDHLTDRRAGGNGTPLPDDLPTRPDPVA